MADWIDKNNTWNTPWLDLERFNQFLLENSLELPKEVASVTSFTVIEIENILWKNPLSELLVKAKEYWIIALSDNLINWFEQEKEIKIFEIDREKLEALLLNWAWAKKVFSWTVKDTYYDFDQDCLETKDWKISFRIREKTDSEWNKSFYYTIKRKEKKDPDSKIMRVCYEKEFRINDIILFTDLLKYLWFYKTRAKQKERVAYELWKIKFDIDTYSWIPTLLEIEASSTEIAEFYINALWLSGNEKSNWWSRSLFEKYWVEYKKFDKPKSNK